MNREPYFGQFALAELLPFAEKFPLQYMHGKNNIRLAYRHFIQQQNEKSNKLVILVNGRAENILKWTEVAYDFYYRGYDVLVFDHRGQGFSDRLNPDPEKGDIDQFSYYVDDMQKLIERITSLYRYNEQFIIAHSLGALISTFYLAYCPHKIKSAVFSAPFYGIPMDNPNRDQWVIKAMILLQQGGRYVFGKTAYKPADINNNHLSHCKTRMKWMNRINRKNPPVHLGGPTFRWVHECFKAIQLLPKVIPKINLPILLLQSPEDKIVNNQNMEKLTALFPQIQLHMIENAKHEILFEQDNIRNSAIKLIYDFFRQ